MTRIPRPEVVAVVASMFLAGALGMAATVLVDKVFKKILTGS